MGSAEYMAPEQMLDPRAVDSRADIWALGATLFHAVVGRPPFEGDTIPAVCARVLTAPPPRPTAIRPELPDALEQIVLRCLDRDPERRYQSAADLAHALEPLGVPVEALETPTGVSRAHRAASPDVLRRPRPSPAPLGENAARTEHWRWPRVLLGLVAAAAFVIVLAVVTTSAWRITANRFLTPGPLEIETASPIGPSHAPPPTRVLAVRGAVGETRPSASGGGTALIAERERKRTRRDPAADRAKRRARPEATAGDPGVSAPRDPDAIAPRALTPAEIERRKRAYREYLESEGLRPLDEVLDDRTENSRGRLREFLNDPALKIPAP